MKFFGCCPPIRVLSLTWKRINMLARTALKLFWTWGGIKRGQINLLNYSNWSQIWKKQRYLFSRSKYPKTFIPLLTPMPRHLPCQFLPLSGECNSNRVTLFFWFIPFIAECERRDRWSNKNSYQPESLAIRSYSFEFWPFQSRNKKKRVLAGISCLISIPDHWGNEKENEFCPGLD